MSRFAGVTIALLAAVLPAAAAELPQWKDLFNGKDFTGWVNVNTAPDTWKSRTACWSAPGIPSACMRTERQYENFVLHVEWMHTEPGGNSGMFLWSGAKRQSGQPVSRRRRSADARAGMAEAATSATA